MRILAVDLGRVRTGLAICDPAQILASPIGTVDMRDPEKLLQAIAEIAADKQAEKLVIGHPKNMDGSCGESAEYAEMFAEKLGAMTGLPVVLWDERLTTVSAADYLNKTDTRGKKRKAIIDTVSATIILQNYLDSLK